MQLGGMIPFSLSDFPGRMSAIVFTQGCNFRCPFCHNGDLIPMDRSGEHLVPEDKVLDLLRGRRGKLEGLVITGGEPTLQPGLRVFIRRVKDLGYVIKLDTNGSRPEILRKLLQEDLLDYIAMDIKAPLSGYDRLSGVHVDQERLKESIQLIAESCIKHEFRTTVVESLMSEEDCKNIKKIIPKNSFHRWQEFEPDNALDPKLRVSAQKEDCLSNTYGESLK